jgi:uncharacterized protein (DUF1684 family)
MLFAVNAREHEQLVERWREARLRRLLTPTGWLSVVDRIELVEGDNEVLFGTVTLREGVAQLRTRPGHAVTMGGEPVQERTLRSDEDGVPDALSFAGRIYELVRRGDDFALRVKDPLSPARLGFSGLAHYPIDFAHRVIARFERHAAARETVHQYDRGAGSPRMVPGVARFELQGQPLSLEPTLEQSSGRLFFLFADATNRTETYPAGRFLYADIPAGDELVLDFNLSFNPPCAFTPFVACPVVPPQSRLAVAVTAGEKRYPAP